jgi:uncharacterized Rmd1/YagE family protein
MVAYCFTLDDESFDMKGSARALRLHFSSESATFLNQEAYHLFLSVPGNVDIDETNTPLDLFVFRDGSVVFWNTPPDLEAAVLGLLEPFRMHKDGDERGPGRETMRWTVDPVATNVSSSGAIAHEDGGSTRTTHSSPLQNVEFSHEMFHSMKYYVSQL